jgi:hypothetical protein
MARALVDEQVARSFLVGTGGDHVPIEPAERYPLEVYGRNGGGVEPPEAVPHPVRNALGLKIKSAFATRFTE